MKDSFGFFKGLVYLLLILGVSSAFLRSQNLEEKKYAIAIKTSNVRSLPSLKGTVVYVARAGEKMDVLEDLGSWIKVKTSSGTVGYIWAKLVRVEVEKIIKPSPSPSPSPPQPKVSPPVSPPSSGVKTQVTKKRSLLPLYIAVGAATAGGVAYFLFRKGGLLNKGTATLHVSSSPSEAKVYIDGAEKCETPCTVEKVEPGKHTIKVERELYGKWEQEMEVKGHEEYNIEAELAPFKYEADFCFGNNGTGDGEFSYPWDVTIDDDGNIYVADHGNHRLQKFNSSGNFITKHNVSSTPTGIVYSPHNNRIYAVFNYDSFHALNWYTLNLSWVSRIGLGLSNKPRLLGVDSDGNIYIADAGNGRIVKTDSSGTEITHWSTGTGTWPEEAAPGPDGDVYVSLYYSNKVKIFSSSGAEKGGFSKIINHPAGIIVDKMGHVYVTASREHKVYKFMPDGEEILYFGSEGSGDENFKNPFGIAIYDNGDLVIADDWNHRICIWRLSDETISSAYAKITVKRRHSGPNRHFRRPATALISSPSHLKKRKPIRK